MQVLSGSCLVETPSVVSWDWDILNSTFIYVTYLQLLEETLKIDTETDRHWSFFIYIQVVTFYSFQTPSYSPNLSYLAKANQWEFWFVFPPISYGKSSAGSSYEGPHCTMPQCTFPHSHCTMYIALVCTLHYAHWTMQIALYILCTCTCLCMVLISFISWV